MRQMMVHYPPQMGLRPRPMDDYDRLCLRYYRASMAGNLPAAAAVERDLRPRFGADCLDDAFSAGRMLSCCDVR